MSFEYVQALVNEGPDQLITPDNFAGLVNILDEFGQISGKATEERMRHGRRAEPLTTAK